MFLIQGLKYHNCIDIADQAWYQNQYIERIILEISKISMISNHYFTVYCTSGTSKFDNEYIILFYY